MATSEKTRGMMNEGKAAQTLGMLPDKLRRAPGLTRVRDGLQRWYDPTEIAELKAQRDAAGQTPEFADARRAQAARTPAKRTRKVNEDALRALPPAFTPHMFSRSTLFELDATDDDTGEDGDT